MMGRLLFEPTQGMDLFNEWGQGRRLLVFNCHEAWAYQLRALGLPFDIVVGLPGRYCRDWDLCMRPVPPNSRLISLDQALGSPEPYACLIVQNLTDLLDVRSRPEPRLLILHLSLEAKKFEERSTIEPGRLRDMAQTYLALTGTLALGVTEFKARSWGVPDVVHNGVDPEEYLPHTGELACGIRVCNFILKRRRTVLWHVHQEAFEGLPVRIVGHNPGIPGAAPSHSWDHLRQLLRSHRFCVHTADPRLEDGYNMATLEAMAAGLPVLGNVHPTSPIRHGVSGFLSDDPMELRRYAERLLSDRDLAHRMGEEARRTAISRFPLTRFKHGLLQAMEAARCRRLRATAPPHCDRIGESLGGAVGSGPPAGAGGCSP